MTAGAQFNDLPVETLSAICGYLGDSHPRSVLSLALSNKRCYSVACTFLYRNIAIKTRHPERLVQDVQQCEQLLRRDSAFRHVRRFVVYGRFEGEGYRDTTIPYPMPCEKLIGSPDEDDDEMIGSFVSGLRLLPPDLRDLDFHQFDAYWNSLCHLIDLLPALTDFIFASTDLLPPCLLETLHRHFAGPRLNRFRLHVFPFVLRSLTNAEIPNPHELALASSPLLHRIWVQYHDTNGYDFENMPTYQDEAVMELVRGLAPNLKDVRIERDSRNSGNWALPPRPRWKGFPMGASTLGSLHHLELENMSITGPLCIANSSILRWMRYTDFSALQTLKLRRPLLVSAVSVLAEHGSLQNLRSLTLEYDSIRKAEEIQLLQEFLGSLSSLRSLQLVLRKGPAEPLAATAFPPGLRKLHLPTAAGILYHRHLPAIIRRCPLIEDLEVALPRGRGDAEEVARYRAIGSLARLRRLALSLYVRVMGPEPRFLERSSSSSSHNSSSHTEPPRTHAIGGDRNWTQRVPKANKDIYNCLIAYAADEALATAIFRAVSDGKKYAEPRDNNNTTTTTAAVVPLESMTMRFAGFAGAAGSAALVPYRAEMARSWRVDRDPRDDRRDALRAVEADAAARDGRLMVTGPRHTRRWEERCPVYPLFRHLWPEKPGAESDWREDWRSWPLERLGDDEYEAYMAEMLDDGGL